MSHDPPRASTSASSTRGVVGPGSTRHTVRGVRSAPPPRARTRRPVTRPRSGVVTSPRASWPSTTATPGSASSRARTTASSSGRVVPTISSDASSGARAPPEMWNRTSGIRMMWARGHVGRPRCRGTGPSARAVRPAAGCGRGGPAARRRDRRSASATSQPTSSPCSTMPGCAARTSWASAGAACSPRSWRSSTPGACAASYWHRPPPGGSRATRSPWATCWSCGAGSCSRGRRAARVTLRYALSPATRARSPDLVDHLSREDVIPAADRDRGSPGRLLVLLAGAGDLRSEYRFLVGPLTSAGRRVVTADLPGHGDPTRPGMHGGGDRAGGGQVCFWVPGRVRCGRSCRPGGTRPHRHRRQLRLDARRARARPGPATPGRWPHRPITRAALDSAVAGGGSSRRHRRAARMADRACTIACGRGPRTPRQCVPCLARGPVQRRVAGLRGAGARRRLTRRECGSWLDRSTSGRRARGTRRSWAGGAGAPATASSGGWQPSPGCAGWTSARAPARWPPRSSSSPGPLRSSGSTRPPGTSPKPAARSPTRGRTSRSATRTKRRATRASTSPCRA